MASLVPSETVTITNNGGSPTYTFTDNGSFIFEFVDLAGNTSTEMAMVEWIDKTPPLVIGLSDDAGPVQTKTWTWNANEAATFRHVIDQSLVWTSPSGPFNSMTTASQSEGDGLWYLHVQAMDGVGNFSEVVTVSVLLDNTAPTSSISYTPTGPDPTNQDVTTTLTLSDGTVTSAGGNVHTFSENGSFAFEFVDEAGNTGSATATVDWIDKEPPTAALVYSITGPTNQDVIVTLVPSETVTVTNNGGIDAYTFADNGSFTFEFIDLAGNPGSVTAAVAWIEKTPPTATLSYSTTGPTNQDVNVTMVPSEPVTVTNNAGNPTYTFTDNGSFTFEFSDEAGNTGGMEATVDWIDKIPPSATFAFSTSDLTNQDVVVSLLPSETVTVTNNGGQTSRVFSESGPFTG
jgi:hypothetical protein